MINLKPIIHYRSNGTIRYFFLTLSDCLNLDVIHKY